MHKHFDLFMALFIMFNLSSFQVYSAPRPQPTELSCQRIRWPGPAAAAGPAPQGPGLAAGLFARAGGPLAGSGPGMMETH